MATRKKYQITATAFDKRGRPISTGISQYTRSHPLQKYFSVKAGLSDERIYLHAEVAAIIQAGKRNIDSVFVQRFHNNGDMANAHPCPSCCEALKAFGVRLVRYTDSDGIKEKLVEEL